MDADRRPEALPSGTPGWRSVLGDALGRTVAWIADLVDPVGWAVEIIGGLLGLVA